MLQNQHRFRNLPAETAVEPEIEEPTIQKQETEAVATQEQNTDPLPKKSKLRDMIGAEAADVLMAKFKTHRFFIPIANEGKKSKVLLRHLAKRCISDYPEELFDATAWSGRLLYPHLPPKMLSSTASSNRAIYENHQTLAETEKRFKLTPEFGVTDPPMLAANKAHAIFTSINNAKKGSGFDSSFVHKQTFADDEGKAPVVVRGIQLWPAESGAGYGYDDLRCAYNMAKDILLSFKEPADASPQTQSLKLRHISSWLPPRGYNSTGATLEGVMTAWRLVVNAYGAGKSDTMVPPMISMKKLPEA